MSVQRPTFIYFILPSDISSRPARPFFPVMVAFTLFRVLTTLSTLVIRTTQSIT